VGLLEIGTVIDETYLVGGLLGQGGMGEVYEVTHARLAGRYAMKVLRPEAATFPDALERFRREAKITSSLRHPNIVQAVDFNALPNGAPYLVMEFVDGRELGADLRLHGALSLQIVHRLVDQVASALAEAHRHGIVHRDLKPQNILLVRLAGQAHDLVKVLDFGISKMQAVTQNLTVDSALIGTPRYMSPEQARGRNDEIDHRTDQFALAAIAYHLLTGAPAFDGDNQQAILYQVVHEPPPPLRVPGLTSAVNARLRSVVERALCKDRGGRFADILSFARAFSDVALGLADTATSAAAALPVTAAVPATPASLIGLETTQGGAAGERLKPATNRIGRRRLPVAVGLVAAVAMAAVWIVRPSHVVAPAPGLADHALAASPPPRAPAPVVLPATPAPVVAPAAAPAPSKDPTVAAGPPRAGTSRHSPFRKGKGRTEQRTEPAVSPSSSPSPLTSKPTGHLVRPDEL
jgi:tRNA A-37 threonylcarbamoyl transferase component Bud32